MSFSYQIQQGDTLSEIAQRYGTTVEEIARLNNIENVNRIFAGQTITVLAPTAPAKFDQRNSRAQWLAALGLTDEYEWRFDDTGVNFFNYGQDFIAQVEMERAAYQSSCRYYYVDTSKDEARGLSLYEVVVTPDETVGLAKTELTGGIAEFNAPNLSIMTKAAGHGGCGSIVVFNIARGSAEVVEVRHYDNCQQPMGDPKQWPLMNNLPVIQNPYQSSTGSGLIA